MPPRERRGLRRVPVAGALVALLHAGLLLALLHAGVWRERQPPHADTPLLLRWVTPAAPPEQPAAPLPVPRPTLPAVPLLQVPAAAALPPTVEPAAEPAPATAPPAARPDPAPRPLVLDLPPSWQRQASAPERRRNPALDDARANSTRPGSIESRIAGVTGDGRWSVEVLPDGRRMYRRGDECRMTQQARSSQLDPFNNAYFTPPPAAGPC